ncbi:hypothetical protein MMC13_000356, partial [Lambiella insularis]|nr:hypothetical protein [Lambiella insularis]
SSIHDLRELDSDQKSDSPRPITDSHFMPTKSSEPYYVVPPGFRPNTFFVGMEKELESIEKRLFDKKRRAMGTACVLIYGQAGAGKSHLARQYVNKNRRRFSGGVFWLHAWSFEELWKDYWQIAQKVVAKDSPELRVSGIGTGREFIEVVKEWFEGRREWLIVLDCVNVDTDEDINKLQRFIPNSRDSSLIYVSRARRLETLERLLRPEAIRVGPLREDDACKLLFKSIPISSPRDVQRKSAKELVKKVGGLPLAINAISCRIAYTHEPLEKYTIRSYSEDEMIGGRYHEIMDDLRNRGHFEAFNLVNVLCFFGPHIPVEMVHLGLGAFKHEKIEVKSTESGATSDINTTFGILMRYGLIERNEPDDRYLMSSSNSSLVDQDSIDMLKMHMVVQKFCCDSLNTTNFLPIFLTYAVRLFCRSFGEADQIIKSRQEHGRVTDYREYLVHGQRLRGHTLQYENKTQLLGKVRKELDPILHLIKEEIRHREPSSSQESVQGPAEFQISVFDRTISSSSSGLSVSGIRTPDRIHLPFALIDKDEHGKPLGQPSKRSSGSMDLASPVSEPRLVHGGPNMHLATAFDGMEHERPYLLQEGLPDEALCQRTISDPRGGDPLQAAHSNGRPQRRAYTKRAFEPSPANTHLNRESVAGSVIRSQKEANGIFSGFSGAVLALAKVHHASPPPSRGSLWSTNSSSRSPAGISSRPTYTETLVGQPRMPSPLQSLTHSPTQHSGAHSGFSTTIERGRTTKDLRPELVPAASEKPFQYHQLEDEQKRVVRSFSHVFAGSNYIPVSAKLTSSFHSYNPPQNGNAHLSYTRFRGYGPGSNPLPSDHSITAMSRHPVLRTAQSQPYNFDNHGLVDSAENPDLFLSRHAILGHSSPPPATKVQMFPGYRSQPLSRDHSHQSRDSAATEPFPGHPTSISPYLNSIAMDSSSSRMRNLGASPAHQSPNLDHYQAVRPTLHHSGSPDTMVRSEPDLLSGAGGWAAPMPGEDQGRVSHFSGGRSNHSPTTALVRPTTRKRPGSRTAVEGLETVEFEREVVFRDFEPTSVAEARRRLREWEIGLKARERQLGTRVGDPSAAVARLSFGVGQEGGERSHLAGWVNTSIADLDIRDQDKTPHLELSRFPVD